VQCRIFAVIVFLFLAQASCTPHTQMQRICAQCSSFNIATPLSPIHVWFRPGEDAKNTRNVSSSALHVYLENDGAPYNSPAHIAANPSLRAGFLALRLMQQDTHASLYLSRPCYAFAFNAMPATCHPRFWTDARYSAEVVGSLNQALDQAKKQLNVSAQKIIIIGHSGGGSLALLMAQKRSDVYGVISLAGNIDTDAWVKLHNYDPLHSSLNPFAQPLLPAEIKRWYFSGREDKNIPYSLLLPTCQKDPQAQCQVQPGVGHEQGWLEVWPQILSRVMKSLPADALKN
jgi:predicted esterase